MIIDQWNPLFRQTSCSTVFIIRNIRIYFDRCPACTDSRNLALLRALSNITALQQPLNLTISNGTTSRISTKICSTPNITGPSNDFVSRLIDRLDVFIRLVLPVRLSLLEAQELSSTLSLTNSTVRTTGRQRISSTPTYSSRASARSSHVFTSRVVPSRKTPSTNTKTTTTTTTTSSPLTEVTSSPMTTVSDSVSTVLSTIPSDTSTESTFTSELPSSTIDSDMASSTVSETIEDTTSEAFTVTISTMTEDTAQTFASSSEQMTTVAEELDSSTSVDYTGATSSSFASITITEELDQTSTDGNTLPSAASVATETISYGTNPTTESLDTSSEDTSTMESTIDEFIGSTSSSADDLTATTGIEELASVSSEEPFTSTSSYDDVTATVGTSVSLDSMTSAYTSTTETEITTSDVSAMESSTISTYLDETSVTPMSHPTTVRPRTTYVPTTSRMKLPINNRSRLITVRPFTTYVPTTSRVKLPTNNRSRPTPGKIMPILPLQPLQPTVTVRNASFTVATIKLDRTRKSTWYSTGAASVTKSRYSLPKAVTSLTTYQTKPVFGRRGNKTVVSPMTTARTSKRLKAKKTAGDHSCMHRSSIREHRNNASWSVQRFGGHLQADK